MLAKTLRHTTIVLFFFFAFNANGQFSNYTAPMIDIAGSSGIEISLGGNTFLGDLGGNKGNGAPFIKDFNSKTIRPFIGAAYMYSPSNWLSIKAGLHFTRVTGADSLITNKIGHAGGRFDRNLSFKSGITEFSAEGELYPFQTMWKHEQSRLRPYVGTGVGVFHFNPKAQLNGEWVALQPLHLEGQGFPEYLERKEYKLTQLYIPLSLGLRYRLSDNYLVSLSATFRKTFTDYIDDVSTTYIDPNLFDQHLSTASAALAKQLYYRGTTGETARPGPYRGYASQDSYTSVFFSITYLFGGESYGFNTPY